MKNIFTCLLLLFTITVFGQNKKEQIAILSARVDSLFQALDTEKSERATTEKELQSQISTLQSQLTTEQNEKKAVESNLANVSEQLKNQKDENLKVNTLLSGTEAALKETEEKYAKTSEELKVMEGNFTKTSEELKVMEGNFTKASEELKLMKENFAKASEDLNDQINQNKTLAAAHQKTLEEMNQKELELAELLGSYNELLDQLEGQMEGEYEAEDALIYNEEATGESSNSGNAQWDKILDEYESFVIEYAKFYKKAMSGDLSAMSKYPALLEKATNLSESLDDAQNNNDLSQKQMNRFLQIQTKLMEAVGY